jgi:DNA-binding XRE family transcriptional regulator
MITAQVNSLCFQDQALMVALAALGERIRMLSSEDRHDLFELTKEFFGGATEEDRDSAARGIMEILEQTPAKIIAMSVPTQSAESSSWIDYVSQKIRALRLAADLTQDELAERSGLAQSHICRLELGQHSPNGATLEKLSRALGVDPSAFELPASQEPK